MLPGSPSFADFHDAASYTGWMNKATIPPYYAMSQFNAVSPYLIPYLNYEQNAEQIPNR